MSILNINKQGINEINEVYVSKCFLRLLKIEVNTFEAEVFIINHSSAPSLLSIKEFLAFKQVGTEVIIINPEVDLHNFKGPFIVHLKTGLFAVVIDCSNERVKFIDPTKGVTTIHLSEFYKIINNILLYPTAIPQPSPQKSHPPNPFKNGIFLLVSSLLLVFVVLFKLDIAGIIELALLCLNVIGIILCLILIFDQSSDASTRYCGTGAIGKYKIDCQGLINKVAIVFPQIDLVDIGATIFLFLSFDLLGFKTKYDFECQIIYQTITYGFIPVILFSISLQLITKTLCLLCLGVQAVLLTELIIIEQFYSKVPIIELFIPNYTIWLVSILVCGILYYVWIRFKHLIKDSNQLKDLSLKHAIVLRNPKVSSLLLGDKVKLPNSKFDITLGSGKENIILLVVKMNCDHCIVSLTNYFKLHIQHPTTTTLIIRVIDLELSNYKNILAFIGKIEQEEIRLVLSEHLNYFYHHGDNLLLQKHNESYKEMGIISVPQVFINFHKIPSLYDFDDIDYLVSVNGFRQ